MPKKGGAGPHTKTVKRQAGLPAKKSALPAKAGVRDDRPKRLLDLVVMLLGSRTPVAYRELQSQFRAYRKENEAAGLRAFERDKVDLLELGVPLRYVTPEEDNSLDEAGYIVDLRRYRLPEVQLTADEVAALVLAGSVARAAPGTTYAEVVDLALKKLAFDLPQAPDTPGSPIAAAKKPREPVLVHFPRPADAAALAERLALLEQATRNHKRVTLIYVTAASGQAATRDVDPYGLVYRQGTWLLVGHCHLRLGVRTFRLDRIMEVTVRPKPKSPDFERPAGFDVRRYAARSPWTFDTEPPVAIELWVDAHASAVVNEDFGADAKREAQPGGSVLVTFRSGNPDYVIARVIAAKGGLVLKGPSDLKTRVHEELGAVLALYRDLS